jgi:hypothetical protein
MWEDDIKIEFRKLMCEVIHWSQLSEEEILWCGFNEQDNA